MTTKLGTEDKSHAILSFLELSHLLLLLLQHKKGQQHLSVQKGSWCFPLLKETADRIFPLLDNNCIQAHRNSGITSCFSKTFLTKPSKTTTLENSHSFWQQFHSWYSKSVFIYCIVNQYMMWPLGSMSLPLLPWQDHSSPICFVVF